MGYYENPREATLSDLAETLDVDPATVGKHLRTIESKVFQQYIP
jgi:predicted DNA binding protein